MKTQLINNLMTHHNGPDYMIKLKAKRREMGEKKKPQKKHLISFNF